MKWFDLDSFHLKWGVRSMVIEPGSSVDSSLKYVWRTLASLVSKGLQLHSCSIIARPLNMVDFTSLVGVSSVQNSWLTKSFRWPSHCKCGIVPLSQIHKLGPYLHISLWFLLHSNSSTLPTAKLSNGGNDLAILISWKPGNITRLSLRHWYKHVNNS